MKTKTIALLLAVALVFGGIVGGTVAWLSAKTTPVVNTFTTSDIGITLTEDATDFKMVPGADITKDPKVTVTNETDVDIYLFVKIDESTNLDDYISYTVANDWELVDGTTNVYWREVTTDATEKEFSVLANDKVTVLNTVTEGMMTDAKTDAPTLTFTAYAIQTEGFTTAAAAWEEAKKLG